MAPLLFGSTKIVAYPALQLEEMTLLPRQQSQMAANNRKAFSTQFCQAPEKSSQTLGKTVGGVLV
jgi:hypothetical protein